MNLKDFSRLLLLCLALDLHAVDARKSLYKKSSKESNENVMPQGRFAAALLSKFKALKGTLTTTTTEYPTTTLFITQPTTYSTSTTGTDTPEMSTAAISRPTLSSPTTTTTSFTTPTTNTSNTSEAPPTGAELPTTTALPVDPPAKDKESPAEAALRRFLNIRRKSKKINGQNDPVDDSVDDLSNEGYYLLLNDDKNVAATDYDTEENYLLPDKNENVGHNQEAEDVYNMKESIGNIQKMYQLPCTSAAQCRQRTQLILQPAEQQNTHDSEILGRAVRRNQKYRRRNYLIKQQRRRHQPTDRRRRIIRFNNNKLQPQSRRRINRLKPKRRRINNRRRFQELYTLNGNKHIIRINV